MSYIRVPLLGTPGTALSHLDLTGSVIGDEGVGRLAGVLGGCKLLSRYRRAITGPGHHCLRASTPANHWQSATGWVSQFYPGVPGPNMRHARMPHVRGADLSTGTRYLLETNHGARRPRSRLTIALLLASVLRAGCEQDVSEACSSSDDPGNQCTKLEKSKVSVLTPTREKTQRWHPLLYECFARQTYRNKELLVLDDSSSPSPFFSTLNDSRVVYIHIKDGPMALGAKRNRLTSQANGTILAQFDDDDWYGPTYLSTMVSRLLQKKASLVKLSGWFVYSCKLSFFGYFDPAETTIFGEVSDQANAGLKYSLFLDPRDPIVQTWVMGPSGDYDQRLRDETRFGFGFSYVYKKKLALKHPFNQSKTFGEDLEFITEVLKTKAKVIHFADSEGLSLHVQGHWNTARIPTQYKIPTFLLPRVFGLSALNYTSCT